MSNEEKYLTGAEVIANERKRQLFEKGYPIE